MNIDYNKILNRNMINVLKDVLLNISKNGLIGNNHLFITFNTKHKNVIKTQRKSTNCGPFNCLRC